MPRDARSVSGIPEPPMAQATGTGLLTMLRRPFADPNFRRLITFLGTWNLAVNLAAPFFTVFMLTMLHMDMTMVMGLSVVLLVPNVLLIGVWGRYADLFSNKTILAVCGPMFILAIFAWTFVMFPDQHRYTLHMLVAIHLVAIHVLMGVATAGVTLASGNIGFKSASKGEATAYLAVLSLVNALAAGLAPICGGLSPISSLSANWPSLSSGSARNGRPPCRSSSCGSEASSSFSRRWSGCSRSIACGWCGKRARSRSGRFSRN